MSVEISQISSAPKTFDGPALSVAGLTIRFGGLTAVDAVTFDVPAGIILGLIGPNGAGKTTLFDAISGLVGAEAGRVALEGRDITNDSPHDRAAAGLGRSFQDGRLFPSLTASECISIALARHVPIPGPLSAMTGGLTARSSARHANERVDEIIAVMGLEPYQDMFVRELSTGTRRLVDLGCAIAHDPRVLLLDEPSSGIAQREVEALGPLIRTIRDRTACTMLLIEHDIPLVTEVSDELLVLETGRILSRGKPGDVVRDPEVIRAYLGADRAPLGTLTRRNASRRSKRKRGG